MVGEWAGRDGMGTVRDGRAEDRQQKDRRGMPRGSSDTCFGVLGDDTAASMAQRVWVRYAGRGRWRGGLPELCARLNGRT